MSIRKRGSAGRFSYQVRVPGFPAVTVPTRDAAEAVQLDLLLRKRLGHLYQEKPARLGAELDDFLLFKETMGGRRGPLRPAGVRWYRDSVKPWAPLREVLVPALRRSTVEDHIVARAAVAPVAAKNELQVLKAALRRAESRGQRVDANIYDIPPPSHDTREARALTLDELDEIASWMPEHIKRIVLLVGLVGLRFTEALTLTDDRVDLAGSELFVPGRLSKNRKPKSISLAAREVQLLREQLLVRAPGATYVFATKRGKAYTRTAFNDHAWYPALEQVGLKNELHFHDLRHTAISLSAKAGIPAEIIAERVGHADGGALIRRRYRHLYPGEAASHMAKLDALVLGEQQVRDGRAADTTSAAPHEMGWAVLGSNQ
jgi:integrase